MPPRNPHKKHKGPFDHESVPLEALPISVRSYVKGVREFNSEIQPYRNLIHDIPTFAATNRWIEDIVSVTVDANEIIDNEINEKYRSHSQIYDLIEECAQYLESVLDNMPLISIDSTDSWDEDCPTMSDMGELVDRINEAIKHIGYNLHSYLIRSSI